MIDDVLFVGATLWTDFELFGNRSYAMNRAADAMNDYRKIRKNSYAERLRPADTVVRHFGSREFIARAVRETPARRKVVISTPRVCARGHPDRYGARHHLGCVRQRLPRTSEWGRSLDLRTYPREPRLHDRQARASSATRRDTGLGGPTSVHGKIRISTRTTLSKSDRRARRASLRRLRANCFDRRAKHWRRTEAPSITMMGANCSFLVIRSTPKMQAA